MANLTILTDDPRLPNTTSINAKEDSPDALGGNVQFFVYEDYVLISIEQQNTYITLKVDKEELGRRLCQVNLLNCKS